MTAHAATGGRIRQVGKVVTEIRVTNHVDEILATHGASERVRSIVLAEVLVDTGASTLCLPIDIIRQLGLPMVSHVAVATATGTGELELYEDIRLEIEGRSAIFDCLALPAGAQPLLGVLPLERLGLEPDLQNQRLRVLPDTGRDTYMLAPSPILY